MFAKSKMQRTGANGQIEHSNNLNNRTILYGKIHGKRMNAARQSYERFSSMGSDPMETLEVLKAIQDRQFCQLGCGSDARIRRMSPVEFGNFVGRFYGVYSQGSASVSCKTTEG